MNDYPALDIFGIPTFIAIPLSLIYLVPMTPITIVNISHALRDSKDSYKSRVYQAKCSLARQSANIIDLEKKSEEYNMELNDLKSQRLNIRKENNIPEKYKYYELQLLSYLHDNRADSMKEAIEVFELDKHRNEMKSIQQQQQNRIVNLQNQIQYQARELERQAVEIERARSDASHAEYMARKAKRGY